MRPPVRVLLVGPYDPHGGEYTFLAPPLGVWRLCGVLENKGIHATVFDPNCCDGDPALALERLLAQQDWTIVGISTTGMTLRYDLQLAHLARRCAPEAVIVAGGMEATFNPDQLLELGPFDLVVLGEGEKPLQEIVSRIQAAGTLDAIPGTAVRNRLGFVNRYHQPALSKTELRDAIALTPYEKMPYAAYWERLERAYRVHALPAKADREARLAEIRSVRLITLNYCPMNCTFCSSTNFLTAAQGSTASLARLDAADCVAMITRIVSAQPLVRTVIFQDDIFVFTKDARTLPLCDAIVAAKQRGEIPADLQFISTNRIDALDAERLTAMKRAGFRVLGFGVENFSIGVLEEFNKKRIHPYIDTNLRQALDLGITPFLDLILTSPRCTLGDFAETIRRGYHWLLQGCEMGMYPYVIPFSGAAMANDASLYPHTVYVTHDIAGTDIVLKQAAKILPIDPEVRAAILETERRCDAWLEYLETRVAHLPSRLRSLVWVMCAASVLAERNHAAPDEQEVFEQLLARLPGQTLQGRNDLRTFAASHSARVESHA